MSDSTLGPAARLGARFSRRHFLAMSAAVGATTLLAACGGDDDAPTEPAGSSSTATSAATAAATAESTTTAGSDATATAESTAAATEAATSSGSGGKKTFRFAVTRDITDMDPALISSTVDYVPAEAIYNYPARYTYDPPLGSEVIPELTTWETDEEGKTFTFTIEQGVMFHGGYGEMTSEDFLFCWERIQTDETGSPYQTDFEGAEITAPDDYTVVVTFQEPSPAFITGAVAFRPGLIISKKAFEEKGEAWNQQPIGSGPFEWVEWQTGVHVRLKRNENYFGTPAKLDEILLRLRLDERTSVLAVAAGEIDAYYINSTDLAIDAQNNTPSNTKFLLGEKGIQPVWVEFNLARPEFQDLRVRQAFNHAMDRESIANDLYGGLAQPLASFLPPFMLGYTDEGVMTYPYDPEKAKALLEEANFPFDSFAPSILTRSGVETQEFGSEVTQQFLSALGINAKIDLQESGTFIEKQNARNYDMITNSISRIDPDQLASPSFHSASPANRSGYSGADDLIEAAKREPNRERRIELYGDLQRKLAEDLPVVFLVSLVPKVLVNETRVTGGIPGAGWQSRFDWFNIDVVPE